MDVHASLIHAAGGRINSSGIFVKNFELKELMEFTTKDCAACRIGGSTKPASKHATAPSAQGCARGPSTGPSLRQPSTTGYRHFGQRVDSDICTTMPVSWPHGYTSMLNFVDRHTAEYFLYFLAGNSSSEIGSALNEHCQKLHHRLPEGGIGQWHTDNEKGFNDPEVSSVAEDLVRIHTKSVPYDSNTNPVAERNFGILGSAMRRILAHADAPSCLCIMAVGRAPS